MILKSLCRMDLKSVYLYTFPQEIAFHRGDIWEKPNYVKLQAYYQKKGKRTPQIHYQPMPIYTYPVKDQDVIQVKGEEREIQYGFLIWEVEPEYFCQISKMSYQVSNALKIDRLLSSRNQLVEQLEEVSRTDPLTGVLNRRGYMEKLGTNPVFPKVATMNRIKWAGLDAEDFELITTYEDNCYCKPNVDYYRTILEQFHLRPEECLMVGNDVEEDLAIRKLGVKTFLVTDTKENKKDLPIESDYQGSMEELFAFVESLENA